MFMIKLIATELWSRTVNPETYASENEIGNAIVHLENCSDRVLEDMGLTRGDIDDAVRHGRAENDSNRGRRAA